MHGVYESCDGLSITDDIDKFITICLQLVYKHPLLSRLLCLLTDLLRQLKMHRLHAVAVFKKKKKKTILPISDFWHVCFWSRNVEKSSQKKLSATIDTETTNLLTYHNNNNNTRTIFIVLSSWPQVIARVHSVHLMIAEQRTSGHRPQTKPPDLGCELTPKRAGLIKTCCMRPMQCALQMHVYLLSLV